MKTPLILLALASATFAAPPTKPVALRLATAQQTPTAKSVRTSIVLHDGTNWTIIPSGALVFMPATLRDKVDAKPVGNLLRWSDFLAKNASWITTDEVTFDQAAGTKDLPASQAAAWKAQEKLVVAVHRNGPVSVTIGSDLQAITRR